MGSGRGQPGWHLDAARWRRPCARQAGRGREESQAGVVRAGSPLLAPALPPAAWPIPMGPLDGVVFGPLCAAHPPLAYSIRGLCQHTHAREGGAQGGRRACSVAVSATAAAPATASAVNHTAVIKKFLIVKKKIPDKKISTLT